MNAAQILIEKMENLGIWERTLSVNRNEYVKEGNSIDSNIYFIVNGSLRIFVIDETEEHTIRLGYRNNIIAALDSFITNRPSDLYIQALKKTKLKVVGKEAFLHFIENSPENSSLWRTVLGELIYQQMERERDILTSSPDERYRRVLERSPQLFQEIPHKYIASYLRMAPETLSRIIKS
ncbi:cyclic nucleotide-binding domain-containing protein [uncultured Kriegella sp.]|uniref:Crp/Fnr family transcriptional regulator n=1 Tax=uncultured Kriegella sp. TaxID=1798910 RepID=UPI0030DB7DD6|tara:strand:+ start:111111 stop:111647 length:537 start_codon:yes stop_codon:yes gene_type:complete